MYKAKPVWVKPQPRVRLQTEADTLRASLHDTILKQVLREKGSDTGGRRRCRSRGQLPVANIRLTASRWRLTPPAVLWRASLVPPATKIPREGQSST